MEMDIDFGNKNKMKMVVVCPSEENTLKKKIKKKKTSVWCR